MKLQHQNHMGSYLTLTRKLGEKIIINNNIEVWVKKAIGNSKFLISISAPREIPIFREEIHLQMQHDQAKAAK
jgi:carbon storage regulator